MVKYAATLLCTVVLCGAGPAWAQSPNAWRPESANVQGTSGGDCSTYGPCNITAQNYDVNTNGSPYGELYYRLVLANEQVLWGWGSIPKGVLLVDGEHGRARLNVDTRTLSAFTAYTCSGFAPPPAATCVQDGGVGIIELEFNPDGIQDTTRTGMQKVHSACCGTYTERFRDVEFTTGVVGTVGTVPFVPTDASVASHRYSYLEQTAPE
jgi:hypothetical protein